MRLFDKMISLKSASRLAIAISTTLKPTHSLIPSSNIHNQVKRLFKSDFVVLFRDINNIQDALIVFDKMLQLKPSPPPTEFNKFFNIVRAMNHFDHVIVMFKELCLLDRPFDENSMEIVAKCYCELRHVDCAFAIFATFLKLGYPPNSVIIGCLVKGLFEQGKARQAAHLFDKVIDEDLFEVDSHIVVIVLDGLCKSGRVGDAVQLLGDLEYVDGTLSTNAYTVVIDGLCRRRKVDDAMELLAKMIRQGYRPDVVTYTVLMRGLCYYGRMDEVKKLVTEMIDHRVYPKVQTFNAIVDTYCKDGAMEGAEDVVRSMEDWDVKPDLATYNALVNGYCLLGQLDKAMAVLDLMVKKGRKPCVVSYAIVIRGYCMHGQLEYALKLFNEMPHKGLTPSVSVYNIIIQGLRSAGRTSEAFDLYNEMKIVWRVLDS